MDAYFIGVDVGTGSVRAALVSTAGVILKVFVQSIRTWNPKKDFYEQSSNDIWRSCVICIKEIIKNIDTENIKGIGFDATCSLVCLDTKGDALSISPTGNDEQNVILWMDHRASEEAAKINRLNHSLLRYVGGKVSLEMEIPKLLWLKTNMKERCWDKVGLFFDLPDFLTWKATGCESRSLCSTVCKWMYEVNVNADNKWNENFFQAIEIDDLLNDNSRKIGNVILSPGSPVGRGLSKNSAEELGLKPGTPVGSSLIDAHAGGLGLIGCLVDGINDSFHTRLALICGTSTCHMAVSANPIFVPGVWGPYYSAMIPGMWLSEGGQSATGKLLDHIIETHPATAVVRSKLGNIHVQQYLSNLLEKIAEQKHLKSLTLLTANLHVWPDFHGNRSPVSDSSLKGSVCGLTLSVDEENLALLYLATVQAISKGILLSN